MGCAAKRCFPCCVAVGVALGVTSCNGCGIVDRRITNGVITALATDVALRCLPCCIGVGVGVAGGVASCNGRGIVDQRVANGVITALATSITLAAPRPTSVEDGFVVPPQLVLVFPRALVLIRWLFLGAPEQCSIVCTGGALFTEAVRKERAWLPTPSAGPDRDFAAEVV